MVTCVDSLSSLESRLKILHRTSDKRMPLGTMMAERHIVRKYCTSLHIALIVPNELLEIDVEGIYFHDKQKYQDDQKLFYLNYIIRAF